MTTINWNDYAESYDFLNELAPYQAMFRRVVKEVNIQDTDFVLDAACGTGNFAHYFKETNHNSKANFFCIDMSQKMLNRAILKYSSLNAVMHLTSLDEPLPYPRKYFDKIVSINTLYATAAPEKTLHEFYELLKDTGRLILVMPQKSYSNKKILETHYRGLNKKITKSELLKMSIEDLLRSSFRNLGSLQWENLKQILEHNQSIANQQSFHFFTQKELGELATDIGFKDVKTWSTYALQNIFLTARVLQ